MCLFLLVCRPTVLSLFLVTKLEEKMAGKGRKAPQQAEEESDRSESGSEMQILMRMFLASQEKAGEIRREEVRAAEQRAEDRAEAKWDRKAEERRKAEEKEAAREEAAKLERDRIREQQEAMNNRMYDQQVALVKLQADIGEKAAEAYRKEQNVCRQKDRAVAGISIHREDEDVEDFLCMAERKLTAGGVPEADWVAVIASKLGGKLGSTWYDLSIEKVHYGEVKAGFLKVCGYTPKMAGELFFGYKSENLKGVTADQLYARGVQLARRMLAPHRLAPEAEFLLVKPWIWSVIPKRARQILDARVVATSEDLLAGLQDYLVTEGENREGQAAVFGGVGGDGGRERFGLNCFKCGRLGHKAADCWNRSSSNSGQLGKPAENGPDIKCFTCGLPGHKSSVCPSREKRVQFKTEPKDSKSFKRIRKKKSIEPILDVKVNGQVVPVLLDSGSAVTVVPERMVAKSQRTGEVVEIKGFGASRFVELPLAEVPFEVGGLNWVEEVALTPEDTIFEEEGVVLGLDLMTALGKSLVLLINGANLADGSIQRRTAPAAAAGTETDDSRGDDKLVEVESEEENEDVTASGENVHRLRSLVCRKVGKTEEAEEVGGAMGGVAEDIQQLELDASLVMGAGAEPDVCTQVSYDFCKVDYVSPPSSPNVIEQKEQHILEEEQQEPRAAQFLVVGGDVGPAHRDKRWNQKYKEKDREKRKNSKPWNRGRTDELKSSCCHNCFNDDVNVL